MSGAGLLSLIVAARRRKRSGSRCAFFAVVGSRPWTTRRAPKGVDRELGYEPRGGIDGASMLRLPSPARARRYRRSSCSAGELELLSILGLVPGDAFQPDDLGRRLLAANRSEMRGKQDALATGRADHPAQSFRRVAPSLRAPAGTWPTR
jgi:hypothetical protein